MHFTLLVTLLSPGTNINVDTNFRKDSIIQNRRRKPEERGQRADIIGWQELAKIRQNTRIDLMSLLNGRTTPPPYTPYLPPPPPHPAPPSLT